MERGLKKKRKKKGGLTFRNSLSSFWVGWKSTIMDINGGKQDMNRKKAASHTGILKKVSTPPRFRHQSRISCGD